MKKENSGYTMLAILLMVFVVGAVYAANNEPPTGFGMYNRDRAKWAMGKPIQFLAESSTNKIVNPTGVEVGDYIAGVVNLDDLDDAFPVLSTLTIEADKITAAGTPFTANETYLVTVWRKQAGR